MRRKKLLIIAAGGLALGGMIVTAWCNWVVSSEAARTYGTIAEVPGNRVGLVLGCSQASSRGGENPFFRSRIEAAWKLFEAGKIEYVLVSGDNHRAGYDEPTDMKQALVALGVPPERIVCDYAGFTTLDSVVRCKEVFQQSAITVISQKFHNERAIYIARAHGIDAVGFNAEGVGLKQGFKTYVREAASRVKAVLDVRAIGRKPKFLGEPVAIGKQPTSAA
jgi:SanA protein